MGSPSALAVGNLGLFELDGNAIENVAPPPDDWETLCDPDMFPGGVCQNLGGSGVGGSNTFTGINEDPDLESIFTGGRKDIQDIPDWGHKDGSVPDKDDITHAYAAAYTNMTDTPLADPGDLIIYFGSDRIDASGDAFMGYWFFQDDVEALPDGTFSGVHIPGDVLVLANYPQSTNAVPLIKVIEWDPTCSKAANNNPQPGQCSAANLRLIAGVEGAGAVCSGTDTLACAISNSEGGPNDPTPSPWAYVSKNGDVNEFPFEIFLEGGINLTKLLPQSTGCFSSFMAETRSSSSFTASLKDFRLDEFELCGIAATKACEADINASGDTVNVTFDGTVSNTGSTALYFEATDSESGSMITAVCFDTGADGCDAGDAVPGDLNNLPAATATFTLLGGETVRYEGSYDVTGTITSLEFSDTVTVEAFESSSDLTPILTETADADCMATGTPGLAVVKDCSPSFTGGNTFTAAITGSAANTGNVKLVNVALSDTVFSSGELTVVSDTDKDGMVDVGEPAFDGDLEPGEQLAYEATFISTSVTSHSNTMTVTGENAFDASDTVSDMDTASCSITTTPAIAIEKVCDDSIGGGTGVELIQQDGVVVVQVGNLITVSNAGNEVLDPVVVSDSEVDLLVYDSGATGFVCSMKTTTEDASCIGSLVVGESVVFKQTYLPDGDNIVGALTTPGGVSFVNEATASGAGVLSTTPVGPVSDDAECALCP